MTNQRKFSKQGLIDASIKHASRENYAEIDLNYLNGEEVELLPNGYRGANVWSGKYFISQNREEHTSPEMRFFGVGEPIAHKDEILDNKSYILSVTNVEKSERGPILTGTLRLEELEILKENHDIFYLISQTLKNIDDETTFNLQSWLRIFDEKITEEIKKYTELVNSETFEDAKFLIYAPSHPHNREWQKLICLSA